MTESFGVSVVVPIYNSAKILPNTIARLTEYLGQEFPHYELILVDDASSDASPLLLQAAAAENKGIRILKHELNKGQQQTLADGAFSAENDIVLTVDADLPCALADLKKLAYLAHSGIELVLSKRTGGLRRSWWRNLGSQLANWVFRVLYPFRIADFGCGIAAVHRSLIEKLRNSSQPIRVIKLDLLNLAKDYIEVEIDSPLTVSKRESTYSFFKLLKLFWTLLAYKFR